MSYKVYPVVDTKPFCNDYRVCINGEEVKTNTARVSAIPFNRRWPGHQRQIEQSEPIQFLSLSTDEPLVFEITPREPFKEVKIRPRSLGITPRVTNGKIIFTLEKPAYFTVEPYGRNHSLHIFADPPSDYIAYTDPSRLIYFGAGKHYAGMIELKSNQTLFIDEGAVVYACVHATDAENIKIIGRGILDNSQNKEKILFAASEENNSKAVKNAIRSHTIQLEYCKDIEIEGITIRDSLLYNIRPIGCEGLKIKNLKIIGCWRYNSDGIDMHNCVDTHVCNCFIRSFDDSVCVKGFDCYYEGDVEEAVQKAMYRNGKSYDVFKNALIENCVIWNDWGNALEIGAETRAEEIDAITFRSCDIIHLTGPALDCTNVDYAQVSNITFSAISIEADEVIPTPLIQSTDAEAYYNSDPYYTPPTIGVSVIFHHEYSAGGERRGRNRDIIFKNINLYGKPPIMYFSGYDDSHKTENVLISDFTLNGKPLTEMPKDGIFIGNFAENIRWETNEKSSKKPNKN